jgi:hypothetical protein
MENDPSRRCNFGVGWRRCSGRRDRRPVLRKLARGDIVPDDVTIGAISEGVRGYVLDRTNAEGL